MSNRYVSSTAFIDLLFNIVIGVAFLFILAFLLINPVAKKQDIESKADYLIILTWDVESQDDIDLWVRDPLDKTMSFKSKDVGFMHLDRDDLGQRNDKIIMPDGTVKILKENREIAALRGTVEGWYIVNIHAYRKRGEWVWSANNTAVDESVDAEETTKCHIEVIQVNPYRMVAMDDVLIKRQGQEETVFRLQMNDVGLIVSVNNEPISLIKASKGHYSLDQTGANGTSTYTNIPNWYGTPEEVFGH